MSTIAFSFCIYGSEKNYYHGLLENIDIIKAEFTNYSIYIYKGVCDPSWVFPDDPYVKIIETGKEGAINMLHRYIPVLTQPVGFTRDADSRITKRDLWCINQFLNSDKKYHVIRDHFYHRSKILGGLFGWKQAVNFTLTGLDKSVCYGYDESYINEALYPLIKNDILVHSNICGYAGETVNIIERQRDDTYDFVGNVIWDGKPKFQYMEPSIVEIFIKAKETDNFKIIKYNSEKLDIESVPYKTRSFIYDNAYIANYYLNDIKACQYWLSQFEFHDITPHIYNNSKYLFGKLGKIVATFDCDRPVKEGEIVVVYGNFPDWHLALPFSNKVFRNTGMFFDLKHDIVEYHEAWEKIDVIYIINLQSRPDRRNDILCSLSRVRAPLHRVKFVSGKESSSPYLACTEDHASAIRDFKNSALGHCLIIEDDVIFVDNPEHVWNCLQKMFTREYNFDICFLSISKYGERTRYDDLLSKSKQSCTTSAAYILNSKTVDIVYNTVNEGIENMKRTGDTHNNCIDRYWSKLENLFLFKEKLAYQRPGKSGTTGKININLD